MQMQKVNVSDLSGAALDWCVAKCEGYTPVLNMDSHGSIWRGWWESTPKPDPRYRRLQNYSTDWAQGGPIIERELICLKHGKYIETSAYIYSGDGYAAYVQGPTALVAAMRCYIASKLGEVVEVPAELFK